MQDAPPLPAPPSPRPRFLLTGAVAVGIAFFLATSATRVLRDTATSGAPTAQTYELDADNYYAAPRQHVQGVGLERCHAGYVVHVPLQALLTLPMAAAAPSHTHEAIRIGTVLLHAALAAWVAWRALRSARPGDALWPAALLLGWVLSPGLWGLARLAYAEWFVGLALAAAVAWAPEPGAPPRRAVLGGLAGGLLVASKWYGLLPAGLLGAGLLWHDLAARRRPATAAWYGAGVLAAAALLWGGAGLAYGIDPVASLRDLFAGARSHSATAGRGLAPLLLASPTVLAPRLPGTVAAWLVVLVALRLRGPGRRLSPWRFTVWAASFAVPWLLSSVPYRLWPLLLATPWLVTARAPGAVRTRGEDVADLLLEIAIAGNLLWAVAPPFLAGRGRSAALLAVALALAARYAVRRFGRPAAGRVARVAVTAALALSGVAGAVWQATDWRGATYEWDASARAVAAAAPAARTVGGMLPELWCRHLPGSASWDAATALVPMPAEAARRSDVVILIALPDGTFHDPSWLEGRSVDVRPFPYWRGERRPIAIGIRQGP